MSTCLHFLWFFFFSCCWHNWVGVNLHLFCQSVRVSVSPVAFDRRWSSELFLSWLAFGGITFITGLWGVSVRVVFMVQRCERMEISPETHLFCCIFRCVHVCLSFQVCVCVCACYLDACAKHSLTMQTIFCTNTFKLASQSISVSISQHLPIYCFDWRRFTSD